MPRAIHLALDFDGTLTERDTMSAFADVCYQFQASRGKTDLPPWSHFDEAYMKDYAEHEKEYEPPREQRTSIIQEVEWLRSLKPVEEASLLRVKRAGLFKGTPRTTDEYFAINVDSHRQNVRIRPGWLDLMKRVIGLAERPETQRSGVEIVSVNWSRTWVSNITVSCALRELDEHDEELDVAWLASLEFAMGECLNVAMTGAMHQLGDYEGTDEQLYTSNGKLRSYVSPVVFDNIVEDTNGRGVRIYVGDSTTDLECLLASDLPIIIQDDPLRSGQQDLAETLSRLCIATKPLLNFDVQDRDDLSVHLASKWPPTTQDGEDARLREDIKDRHRRVYTAKDFTDVSYWINQWHARIDESGAA